MARPRGARDKKKRKSRTKSIFRTTAIAGTIGAIGVGSYYLGKDPSALKRLLKKSSKENVPVNSGKLLPPGKKTLQQKRAEYKQKESIRQKRGNKSTEIKERRKKYLRKILSSNEKRVIDGSYSTRRRGGKSGVSSSSQKLIRKKKRLNRGK